MSTDQPKLGVMLPLGSGDMDRIIAVAREAEELGFDGAFAYDHFYAPGTSPAHPVPEAMTTLAAVGASTETINLGTLVARVGVRSPGLLAKAAAQLDDQTNGRFILGLGAGDEAGRTELTIYGVPDRETQDERWALLQESVGAVRALFEGQVWPGGGQTPHIAGPLLPAPGRPHGPPIWIGGMSKASRQVAATMADGWNAWGVPEEVFLDRARTLHRDAEAAGRTCDATWAGVTLVGHDVPAVQTMLERRRSRGLSEDGLWVGTATEFARFVRRLGEGGADWVIVAPAGEGTQLATIAEAVFG